MEYFRIGDVIKRAWGKFKAHAGYLWKLLGIMIVVTMFFEFLYGTGEHSESMAVAALLFLISVLSTFLNLLMQLGLTRASLDLVDNDKRHSWKILFSEHRLVLRLLGASILYMLLVLAGLVFLIVPGIYFAIKHQFFAYLIVDKDMKIVESLKQSGVLTEGIKWQLVGFSLAIFGIILVSMIPLFLGLIITIPLSLLATAMVYRALSRRLEPEAIVMPQPAGTPTPAASSVTAS